MRKLLLIASGLATIAATQPDESDTDACLFVGLRFAHTRSRCDGSRCTEFMVMEDGRYRRGKKGNAVLCAEAKQVLESHLDSVIERPGAELRRKEALSAHRAAASLIRSVSFGVAVDVEELTAVLKAAWEQEWMLAASDWATWKRTLISQSAERDTIMEKAKALDELVENQRSSLFWTRKRRTVIEMCMFYRDDLWALIGTSDWSYKYLKSTDLLIRNAQPRYRPVDARETIEKDPVSRIDWSLWAEGVVDKSDKDVIWAVPFYVLRWDEPARSLSGLSLQAAMRKIVCRDPASVLSPVAGSGELQGLPRIRRGIHTIALCRGFSDSAALFALHAALNPKPAGLHLARPRYGVFVTYDERRVRPAPRPDSALENLRGELTAESLLRQVGSGFYRLILKREFDTRERVIINGWEGRSFAEVCKCLGNAMGWVIRTGGRLRDMMRLHPRIQQLLHPRTRALVDKATMIEILADLSLNPGDGEQLLHVVSHVSDGIGVSLGFGGFALYSDDEWRKVF